MMFKFRKFFVTPLLFLLSFPLSGCFNKLPTTDYEKVQFAFKGVESSLKSPRVNNKKKLINHGLRKRIGGNNPDQGLTSIFNLYKSDDIREDFLNDISYNEPPIIQFQYLKKVFEKVGSGYEFNKKYYDTINGDIYLDIDTGLKKEGEEYKYNYTFLLGININIDDSDLITADVSFDINLNRGNERYTTKWYVTMELNYDMSNTSPNYELLMVTENNESELPFYQAYTYEYDYVDSKNSSINEWRKFCLSTDRRLNKDNNHPNFKSYIDEGCIYKLDATSWYKDGTYYKNKKDQITGEESLIIGEALYTDLGMNANEINADAFFNQSGTQNSVIKSCYEDFSKINKEDIIYDLVCKDDHHHEDEKIASSIRAMNADLTGGAGNYSIPSNITIRQIFNGFIDTYGDKVVIHLYYVDQNNGLTSEITDLSSLKYFIKERDNNEAIEVSLDESLYDALSRSNFQNKDLTIGFYNENLNIGGYMDFTYDGDLPSGSAYIAPTFPEVLKNLGVPEYEGERYTFSNASVLDKEPYKLVIGNTNGNEEANYRTKLLKNGFEVSEVFGNKEYKKQVDSKIIVISINNAQIDNGYLTITITTQQAQEETPLLVVTSIAIVGDFNKWDLSNGCIEFHKMTDEHYETNLVTIEKGVKFKIVINHTWEIHGGYGYNDIRDIGNFSEILSEEGNEHNILANVTCMIKLVADVGNNEILFTLQEAVPVN